MSEQYADVPRGVLYLAGTVRKKPAFWQIQRVDRTVTIKTGLVGTDGKTTKKTLKTEWEARRHQQEAIEQQVGKGFTYVLRGKPPKKPAVAATNAQLEAQLAKDPSDEMFAVYADWLQEHGDVRGELAALQLEPKRDAKLAKVIDKLLWEYRAYFYGPLAMYVLEKPDPHWESVVEARWRAGWIDSLELGAAENWGDAELPYVLLVTEVIPLAARVTSARFLRELVISRSTVSGEYMFHDAVIALVKILPSLPALRRLEIGKFDTNQNELSWSHMGPLGRLWRVAAQLESVKLRAGSMELGAIELPACREFHVETGGLTKANLKAIATAKWPQLETLGMWFGKADYGCNCKPQDIAPILDGKGLGKLKHLALKNSQYGNEIAVLVAKSKILKQLETLDLSMSHITTDVLEKELLPNKARFAKLAKLDLSRCLLDERGQKLAKQLAKAVDVERQRDPSDYVDEGYRYAAVGE